MVDDFEGYQYKKEFKQQIVFYLQSEDFIDIVKLAKELKTEAEIQGNSEEDMTSYYKGEYRDDFGLTVSWPEEVVSDHWEHLKLVINFLKENEDCLQRLLVNKMMVVGLDIYIWTETATDTPEIIWDTHTLSLFSQFKINTKVILYK